MTVRALRLLRSSAVGKCICNSRKYDLVEGVANICLSGRGMGEVFAASRIYPRLTKEGFVGGYRFECADWEFPARMCKSHVTWIISVSDSYEHTHQMCSQRDVRVEDVEDEAFLSIREFVVYYRPLRVSDDVESCNEVFGLPNRWLWSPVDGRYNPSQSRVGWPSRYVLSVLKIMCCND